MVRRIGLLCTTNRGYNMAPIMLPSHQNVSPVSCEKYFPKISAHRTGCWCRIGCSRLLCSWQPNIHTDWIFESERSAGDRKFLRFLTMVRLAHTDHKMTRCSLWRFVLGTGMHQQVYRPFSDCQYCRLQSLSYKRWVIVQHIRCERSCCVR